MEPDNGGQSLSEVDNLALRAAGREVPLVYSPKQQLSVDTFTIIN